MIFNYDVSDLKDAIEEKAAYKKGDKIFIAGFKPGITNASGNIVSIAIHTDRPIDPSVTNFTVISLPSWIRGVNMNYISQNSDYTFSQLTKYDENNLVVEYALASNTTAMMPVMALYISGCYISLS